VGRRSFVTIWEDALDRLDVRWCQGEGCTRGSRDQHLTGFRTSDAVHLTFPPDEDLRESLHAALVLVGRVEAERTFPELEPRVRAQAAYDFATDSMRAAGQSVPKAVIEARPNGGPRHDVRLFVPDETSEAEAPGMVEDAEPEDEA
jgi:hypothetical protein